MIEMKLIRPSLEYAQAIMDFRKECLLEAPKEEIHGGGGLQEYDRAEDWIQWVNRMQYRETCPEGLVDSDIYLAVIADKLVGLGEFRHHINHPVLGSWGGHIGYCVRPSERRKGYGKILLGQLLDKAEEYGVKEILLTCRENNTASERTIRGCGGIYEKAVWSEPLGAYMKRFWIKTDQKQAPFV